FICADPKLLPPFVPPGVNQKFPSCSSCPSWFNLLIFCQHGSRPWDAPTVFQKRSPGKAEGRTRGLGRCRRDRIPGCASLTRATWLSGRGRGTFLPVFRRVG